MPTAIGEIARFARVLGRARQDHIEERAGRKRRQQVRAQGSDTVAYFEGTPIPTTFMLTAVLAFAGWQERIGEQLYGGVWLLGPSDLHPLSFLFVLSGSFMISKTLRIPKI